MVGGNGRTIKITAEYLMERDPLSTEPNSYMRDGDLYYNKDRNKIMYNFKGAWVPVTEVIDKNGILNPRKLYRIW